MSLLAQAKEILAQRRQEAELQAYSNFQKALKIAEYQACRQKIDSLLPKLAKAEACGEKDIEAEREYRAALAEAQKVLKSAGISENDFTPQRVCPKCGDSGYISGEMCVCLKQIVNEIISSGYGIDFDTLCRYTDEKVYADANLGRYLSDKYEMMKKYAAHFPDTKYINHVFRGCPAREKLTSPATSPKTLCKRAAA